MFLSADAVIPTGYWKDDPWHPDSSRVRLPRKPSLLTIEQSLRRENCSAQALAQGHRGADTLERDFSLLRGFLIHLFQEGLGRGLD